MIDKLFEIVNNVKDPEIPTISVVELGVVRNIEMINEEIWKSSGVYNRDSFLFVYLNFRQRSQ